jgi:hypothetical protein
MILEFGDAHLGAMHGQQPGRRDFATSRGLLRCEMLAEPIDGRL